MDFGLILKSFKKEIAFIVLGLSLFIFGILVIVNSSLPTNAVVVEEVEDEKISSGGISNQSDSGQIMDSNNVVVVEISGAVAKPGVYTFPEGTRVINAVEQSGGFTQEADKDWIAKNLNQASNLRDAQKIYIPFTGELKNKEPGQSSLQNTLGVSDGLIGINSADQNLLEKLDGVGPKTAQKIIGLRPFTSLDELVSKKAVSKNLYEKIKNQISLD